MKKAILSILLLGMSCTLMAREPDEMEVTLVEKVKWCQLEGQKLYTQATEQQNPPHLSKMYFDGSMKFFKLERKYMEDLRWHRFIGDLIEAINECDDEDDDYDSTAMIAQVIKQLKQS